MNVSGSRKPSQRMLVIGIGSPHGDDRAGWEVIDRIADKLSLQQFGSLSSDSLFDQTQPGVEDNSGHILRKASSPLDILDWLDVDCETHIVDAATGITTGFVRVDIAALSLFDSLRPGSSHGVELAEVMQLVAALDTVPKQLTVWGVEAALFAMNGDLSEVTRQGVNACAEAILKESAHA